MSGIKKRRYPQLAREALVSSSLRGNAENRFWAKFLDAIILFFPIAIAHTLFGLSTWLVALFLWSLIETLGRGQSPGKWLLGLHVIELTKGDKIGLYQGLLRNFPFAVLQISLLKVGLVYNLLAFIFLAWIALDIYFIFNLRSGIRSGDVLGGTRVFDYKDEHTEFIEQFLKKEENV